MGGWGTFRREEHFKNLEFSTERLKKNKFREFKENKTQTTKKYKYRGA